MDTFRLLHWVGMLLLVAACRYDVDALRGVQPTDGGVSDDGLSDTEDAHVGQPTHWDGALGMGGTRGFADAAVTQVGVGGAASGGATGSSTGGVGGTMPSATGGGGGTGVPCLPTSETLNGKDDNCDTVIDNALPGVDHYNGHSYYFPAVALVPSYWENVRIACALIGYKMLSVETPEENTWIGLRLLNLGPAYWLGLNDRETENRWTWDGTGNPISFQSWKPGQPTNCNKTGLDGIFDPTSPCSPENCGAIGFDGLWGDFACDRLQFRMACEAP
ncbi:MAG: lectin-like protein [Deltaproteobacteria bacterium]|nr:lectin-like protein [Deltaproteobacteria bacterium]